ncbi:MAG: glucose-1-phosphate thymidylyltransferase [Bacillota bacterium]
MSRIKGLILSGGKGTRLRPLTYSCAKQLVPVANRPTIFYGLEAIKDLGIREVGLVVGDRGQEIAGAVGNDGGMGLAVTYIKQHEPLGLAHAVQVSREYLADSPFIMYLGDNIICGSLAPLVERFQHTKADGAIMLAEVNDPSSYGIAEVAGDFVTRLVEKPRNPKSNLAIIGVYLLTSRIFQAINSIQPSWRNELEITDALQWLVEQGGRICFYRYSDWWKDTGRIEDLLAANRLVLSDLRVPKGNQLQACTGSSLIGNVLIGEGTEVKDSIVKGPVIIGAGCRILNAVIGPFSAIGSSVVVERTSVEDSIIMDNCSLVGVGNLSGCVIGRGVTLVCEKNAAAGTLILGEDSVVRIPV